jgi:FPC/CPF motif-containing protein YcgG
MTRISQRLPGLPGSFPVDEQELKRHSTPDDGWLAVEGRVYDVSDFKHPGAQELLESQLGCHLGRDEFDSLHGRGGWKALRSLPDLGSTSFPPRSPELRQAPGEPTSSTLTVYSPARGEVLTADGRAPPQQQRLEHEQLRKFMLGRKFPCKFAQLALGRSGGMVGHYPWPLGAAENGPLICRDYLLYRVHHDEQVKLGNPLITFTATFPVEEMTPEEFEKRGFQQLLHVHNADSSAWPADETTDPVNLDFSLYLGGVFVEPVGMFQNNPRASRRSPLPAIAFNTQPQMEGMRLHPEAEALGALTEKRDVAISGSLFGPLQRAEAPLDTFSGLDHGSDPYGFWHAADLKVERDPSQRPGPKATL